MDRYIRHFKNRCTIHSIRRECRFTKYKNLKSHKNLLGFMPHFDYRRSRSVIYTHRHFDIWDILVGSVAIVLGIFIGEIVLKIARSKKRTSKTT